MRKMTPGRVTGSAIFAMLLLLLSFTSPACPREKISINSGWEFIISDVDTPGGIDWKDGEATCISLPHTWNDRDVLDEIPGYFRGTGWYRRTVDLMPGWEHKRVFLEFEAANQVVVVFINGRSAGVHRGGYNGFRMDITDLLESDRGSFELSVRVDNRHDEHIPPLSADFNFYGGIYRDAWLVCAPTIHFSLDHFGGPGVYWQTPVVSREHAELKIFGFVSSFREGTFTPIVEHVLLDPDGREVARRSFRQSFGKGTNLKLKPVRFNVESPRLWTADSPVTYTLVSRILDRKGGDVIDEVISHTGFRWFEFTADSGFYLNGERMKIHGISRHQDYPGKGNAMGDELHLEDVRSAKEMGCNFLRIAHYPQDQAVPDACDTLGLLTSVEIPVVNAITESPEFTDNCLLMMREMIWQNYNHPSVVMWAYMNEVLLRIPFSEVERQDQYLSGVRELAGRLEQTARELDPYRVTMIPNHGSLSRYIDAGLTEIPMVVGWNLYQGWYSPGFAGFDRFLDEHHRILPDKPFLVTEYGAGHDPRLVSTRPQRFDFTAEYALQLHKAYLEAMEKRDFVAGGLIWILNDFSSEERGDAVPRINNKGVHGTDRKPKEEYWYYRSAWNREPFVKIWTPFPGMMVPGTEVSGNGSSVRMAAGDNQAEGMVSDSGDMQQLKVYTSAEEVAIWFDSRELGTFVTEDGTARVPLPLSEGRHFIRAMIPGSETEDTLSFTYTGGQGTGSPGSGSPGSGSPGQASEVIRVSCGDHRYFFDPCLNELWLPDRPYVPGSWGYTGGTTLRVRTRHGVKPGSDRNIRGTELDPVFQTQRIAPENYRFDLPAGRYRVTLLFSALYDIEGSPDPDQGDERITGDSPVSVFGVRINGTTVIDSLDLAGQYGPFRAIRKSFVTEVCEGDALVIEFLRITGDPAVSGIIMEPLDDPSTFLDDPETPAQGIRHKLVHCYSPVNCTLDEKKITNPDLLPDSDRYPACSNGDHDDLPVYLN